MTKYKARKTVIDGITFDSSREARRWQQLRLLESSGAITDLQRQVKFELLPSVKYKGANRATGPTRYIADFTYNDETGFVVEDSKGAPETAIFKLKRKLLKIVHNIEIRVV